MDLQNVIGISLDFYDKRYALINTKQQDKDSRFVLVTCYNHGEHFPLNTIEHSVYIRYKKPDHYSVFNFCDITADGKVLIELTEQMLAVSGISCADLVVVGRGSAKLNEKTGEITVVSSSAILSTMTFYVDVCETPVGDSEIESSYEYSGLNVAIQKAEANYSNVARLAKSYAVGDAGGIRSGEDTDNAKYYYEQCKKILAQLS